MQLIALKRGHLHGYPVPFDGHKLSLADIPSLKGLDTITDRESPEDEPHEGVRVDPGRIVNSWFSARYRRHIYVVDDGNGRRQCYVGAIDCAQRLRWLVSTCHATMVYKASAEMKAMEKLADLIPDHAMSAYIMTGTFIETSPRSGVSYVFRRLRPTIALRDKPSGVEFLAALCLHPIAYYEETFAGGMVPSDDVIAHLLLMRSDEHMFWRRANQHPMWIPNSGI